MRLGYRSDLPYPYTEKKFDSYAMVSWGDNSLANMVPLPYSADIVEAYIIMIKGLQTMITDIVQNKIGCITRKIDGLLLLETYGGNPLNADEQKEWNSILNEFYNARPHRAREAHFSVQGSMKKEQILWYVELDKFLQECRRNNQKVVDSK